MLQIKQSTAVIHIVFLMVDSTDHVTGKTGLTPTVTLSKNAGAFASPSGAVTEISGGWYKLAAHATDSNTLGVLALHATGTGADPTDMIVGNVVAYDPQDAVRAGLTAMPNAAAAASGGLLISGSNSGTTTLGALTVTGATTFTGATTWTGALTASNASNDFRVNGLVPGATGGLFIAGTNAATTVTTSFTTTFTGNLTGSVASVLGGIDTSGGTVKTLDAAISALATAHGAGSWATATGFSTHSASDVWAIGTRVLTANTNLNDPTAAAIADAVWDEAISGHAISGSTGEALSAAGAAGDPWITALPGSYSSGQAGKIVGDYLNASVSSRASQTSVDDLPTNAELATALGTADDAVLAAVATMQGNVTDILADTADMQPKIGLPTGVSLAADIAAVKSDTSATLADTADMQPKIGTPAGASMAADIAAVKSDTAAIVIDTAEIGTAGAGLTALASAANLATVAGYVDTEVAAIKAKTDNLPASPAATGDIPSASANAAAVLGAAVEGSVTVVQSLRLANSALGGKASGLATTNPVYRDLADSKDRIDATVDADGNRSAVTRDLT